MNISDRLKEIRGKLNLTQPEAAMKFHMPLPSWKSYEKGPSEPGSGALRGLAEEGININWLLTGQGPMLLADLTPKSEAPEPSSPVNYELLQSLIEMLERILKERRLVLEPARKAAAIQIMYEYCMLDEKAASPATVEKFLKLVA